jgi:hypothetical protein
MEDIRNLIFRPERVKEMDDRFRREHEEDEHYHRFPANPVTRRTPEAAGLRLLLQPGYERLAGFNVR